MYRRPDTRWPICPPVWRDRPLRPPTRAPPSSRRRRRAAPPARRRPRGVARGARQVSRPRRRPGRRRRRGPCSGARRWRRPRRGTARRRRRRRRRAAALDARDGEERAEDGAGNARTASNMSLSPRSRASSILPQPRTHTDAPPRAPSGTGREPPAPWHAGAAPNQQPTTFMRPTDAATPRRVGIRSGGASGNRRPRAP